MENLNAEQIKKALECCSSEGCEICPYQRMPTLANCVLFTMGNALALINSQEQRIKELGEENERLRAENEALAISEVKECEISQMLVYRIRDKHPAVMAVISDTVRKMQEQLKTEIEMFGKKDGFVSKEVIFWFIDQIAKELTESEKL